MTDGEQRPERREELSSTLREAISADMLRCSPDLPVVTGDDLALLKQILRRQTAPAEPIDKTRGIRALAYSERSDESAAILARMLVEDPSRQVRSAAAGALALMPAAAAESALLRSLVEEDASVLTEILKALGSVGSPASLKLLTRLDQHAEPGVAKQLRMARATIALRAQGSAGSEIDPESTFGVAWRAVDIDLLSGAELRTSIEELKGPTYGVGLSPRLGLRLKCGGFTHLLLLNHALAHGAITRGLQSEPMIAGIVTLHEAGVSYGSSRYVVMTSPTDDGVRVIVVTTSGDAAYAGEAQPDGGVLHLRLRDVGPQRIPTEIEGTIDDERIELKARVWHGRPVAKKRGEPVPRRPVVNRSLGDR